MPEITLTEKLYDVLLTTAMILLIILLHNTLILYKRKLRENISLMLLSGIIMCAFELLWSYCYGHAELRIFGYIGACGYIIAFVVFGTFFNRFIWERFEILPRRKWIQTVLYVLPNILIFLICVTTPWTHWMIWVDEEGFINEMILFRTLFYGTLMFYLLLSLIPAIYFALQTHQKKQSVDHAARSLIIFAILGPMFYAFQYLVVGEEGSDYLALSLACTLALVYLTHTVNTQMLLESQAKVEAVETDLRIAAKIQTDALPPGSPEFAEHLELELRASMNTAREVGGDFYDYFAIDDHRLCILIADVSGKGTPAALFMMTAKTMIKDYALMNLGTAETFNAVNNRLCENNDEGMFATAWIGILDTQTMTMQYTNAGHNYPMIKRKGEPCTPLKKKHGLFLAGMEDTVYKQSELQLHGGDRLLLYTDGVTEAHNTKGELYGCDRLSALIDKTCEQQGNIVLNSILNDVNDFSRGEAQYDDITMMILTIKDKGR